MEELWGKKRGEPEIRHPLFFHLIDVAMVTQALWNRSLQWVLHNTMARELDLSTEAAGRWLSFFSGLHDIGKASPDFQRKSTKVKQVLAGKAFHFPADQVKTPHGLITAKTLPNLFIEDSFHGGCFPKKFARNIARVLGGHHGEFPNASKILGLSKRQMGDGLWESVRRNLFFELAKLLEIDSLPFPNNPSPSNSFFISFIGLTSVADWIGSNDEYFPYEDKAVAPLHYLPIARERAEKAVDDLGWSGWQPPQEPYSFKKLFTYDPRPLQLLSERIARINSKPGIVMIEVPMGEGKTEAAMYLADSWSADFGQQGCYFALPTQATSNQMFGRVKDFLSHRYKNKSERVNVMLLHGKAALSEEFKRLRLNAIGEETGATVVAESWFTARKRGLLAPFGVGTVDQILLAVLQTRHMFVRLFGLAGKTVIIDEVHAYDTYMSTLLERLLEWLAAMETSVVLLSATLPRKKRRELLKAFTGTEPPEQEAGYPRIIWTEGERIYSESVEITTGRNLNIAHIDDSDDRLVDKLLKTITHGGYVAVVCNTVGRAQETYRDLRKAGFLKEDELYLFHARFPFEERDRLEREVLEIFGKENKRRLGERRILVATQVIEQSLDIDFDLMVTDLAPVDLVIQRSGRVHRHKKHPRPEGMKEAAVWIRMPEPDGEGVPDFGVSAYVYEHYVLLRSYLALKRDTIRIPEEVEEVIEAVYDDDIPFKSPTDAFDKKIEEAQENMNRKQYGENFQAKMNLVPPPGSRRRLIEFLSDFSSDLEEDNPEVHATLQARTRLGPPSVKVICLHKAGDFYALDSGGNKMVDIDVIPDRAMVEELMMREVTISQQGIVPHLIEQKVPTAWKREAMLRHHRILVFRENITTVGNYRIELDSRLGLLIEKSGSSGKGDDNE
jgi:CRISPR-associated endonuclease/helicase Cas3